jgi:hypothetical protein
MFTNYDGRKMYKDLFTQLFDSISTAVGRPFQWQHIHNNRLFCITADMDEKQADGKVYL